ncbi:MAG: iron-containing alcohol dehydrogenase [Acidobacteria bacterium]|nr:iron-containing alcohol dehydrogenase [Acidobacteriota bacterium]MBU1338727.1 iron-containing alcohol dehydrogenase [Acidobacteriota bacterium]MBU1474527.1 iron-containing alcohol dehydrogenase [Acidobacteriota bacterium]
MTIFRFFNPTRIIFGAGSIQELDSVLKNDLQAVRPFLITDTSLRRSGLCDAVLSRTGDIPLFDAVEPNPRHTTVDAGGDIVREYKPDVILALGGGSVLDAAKGIALLATNPGHIADYEGRAKYTRAPLPVIAIPTTCGTGSEVTWVAVITHTGRRFKMSIKGPLLYPAAALVDPDLLKTLPASLIASTGLDALTHAVEAYTVRPATFFTDLYAREAIRLIFSHIEGAVADIGRNRADREGLMKGSLLAGMAFGNSDVGAVHCIAESVGSLYDMPHGTANSIFLPYIMEFNLPAAPDRFAAIARLAGIREDNGDAAARALLARIRELSRKLGIPSFKDSGILESDFPVIAQKSFENNSNPSNAREMTAADYLEILKRAYASS